MDNKYAKVVCEEHGEQYLTEAQYDKAMSEPSKGWRCPVCNCYPCVFDDEYFEKHFLER